MSLSENQSRIFEALYLEHHDMIYKLSLKYSNYNHSIAADVTHNTFIKVILEMEKGLELDSIENMKSYLHTISRNHTMDCMRQSNRYYAYDVADMDEEHKGLQVEGVEALYVQTEELYQKKAMVQMILDELKVKNEIWYTTVIEVFYKKRSQLDVAEEMGMEDTAMYAMVRRIRKWSNKHKIRFEEHANKTTEEVSDGHLFYCDDEFTHSSR